MGYSTRQAAAKLGVSLISLQRYIAQKKIPVPAVTKAGGGKLRIWTEQDIEHVRRVLPSIKNGRKTRYQKKGKHSKKNKP
jgi:DNA-binding transcriptional MerR regulator